MPGYAGAVTLRTAASSAARCSRSRRDDMGLSPATALSAAGAPSQLSVMRMTIANRSIAGMSERIRPAS